MGFDRDNTADDFTDQFPSGAKIPCPASKTTTAVGPQ